MRREAASQASPRVEVSSRRRWVENWVLVTSRSQLSSAAPIAAARARRQSPAALGKRRRSWGDHQSSKIVSHKVACSSYSLLTSYRPNRADTQVRPYEECPA